MTEIDAAIGQYVKTIVDLQTRLANAAAELYRAIEVIKERDARIKELEDKKGKQL